MELFSNEKRVFEELKTKGFQPRVIYDIGASNGVWSDCVALVLPDTEFHLFEPLSQVVGFYKADLDSRLRRRPKFHLHSIALGDTNTMTEMFLAQDGFQSSLLDRGDIPARVPVRQCRLDTYAAQHALPTPDVIKIDSQGAERMILNGAGELLQRASVLMIETWLTRFYGPQTPLMWEILDLLRPQGFSPVRFGECFYDDKHRLYAFDVFLFAERFLATCCLSPEL